MNKYLFKKLEQAHGVSINQLGFIAAELCNNRISDVFEDFFNWFNKDFSGKIIHWTDLNY